jgi:hypothetical protein
MTPSIGIGIAIPFQKGSTFCKEYKAVYNQFTNKPSAADAVIQNAKMLAIVAGGRYVKSERHWEFSVHTNAGGEAQLDWIDPVNHLPVTNVNGCAWDAYNGFTGNSAGSKYLRSNFTPSVNGVLVGQDNICAIIGIGTDIVENKGDFGNEYVGTANIGIWSRFDGNITWLRCNCQEYPGLNNYNSIGYYAVSRNLAAGFDTYKNLIKTYKTAASTALCDAELYICGTKNGPSPAPCNKQLRFAFLFSYLTEAEVQSAIGDENTYLTNYSTNLY